MRIWAGQIQSKWRSPALWLTTSHLPEIILIIHGEDGEGKWEGGRVCSLASFKGHFQTIAQNDRGKHGGVRRKGGGAGGGEGVGKGGARNNHTHSHLCRRSLHPPPPHPHLVPAAPPLLPAHISPINRSENMSD